MRASRTYAWCALTAAVAVGVGAYVRVGTDSRAELATGVAMSADLEMTAHLQRDCAAHQLRVVEDLAAGRLPLAEAADDVLETGRARPRWLAGLVHTFPADPDDRTRVARVLVAWVKQVTADSPDRHEEAVGRVTAELDELTAASDD